MTDWHEMDLGLFATLQRGYDLPYRVRKHGDVPVVTSTGATDTHAEAKEKAPGVVTGRYGTIGEVFFIEEDYWPHNTTLFVKDFHGNDPLFVSYLLRTIDFQSHSGKSGVPGVNRNDLHALRVRIPPTVDEQRSIATTLSDMDELLGALDRLITKKHDLKQAAMQQLLTGKTRLPGFDGKWEVERLGDLAELNRLNVIPASQPAQAYTHFSLPAFDGGKTAILELGSEIGSNKFRVPQNAILVSKLNPRIPRIWSPEYIPENSVASTEWLVLTPRKGVDRKFLFAACSTTFLGQQMGLAATGTTGSHQRISPTVAMDLQIPTPTDINEQTEIAKVLSDMNAEINALEQRRDKTRTLKQAMMQELLAGKTRLI